MDNNFDEIIIETFKRPDKEKIAASFRFVRMATGMNRKELSDYLHIPYNTMRDWEQGLRSMPPYVLELIIYKLKNENKFIVTS
jgi:DNA-binding transcriptional regulator YiaG